MTSTATDIDFVDVESFEKGYAVKAKPTEIQATSNDEVIRGGDIVLNPQQMENGRWTCNHKCKDKTT